MTHETHHRPVSQCLFFLRLCSVVVKMSNSKTWNRLPTRDPTRAAGPVTMEIVSTQHDQSFHSNQVARIGAKGRQTSGDEDAPLERRDASHMLREQAHARRQRVDRHSPADISRHRPNSALHAPLIVPCSALKGPRHAR